VTNCILYSSISLTHYRISHYIALNSCDKLHSVFTIPVTHYSISYYISLNSCDKLHSVFLNSSVILTYFVLHLSKFLWQTAFCIPKFLWHITVFRITSPLISCEKLNSAFQNSSDTLQYFVLFLFKFVTKCVLCS
jgi:hypothetical protein